MKVMKIRIETEDHCRVVQQALFRLGYDWWSNKYPTKDDGGRHIVRWTDSKFLLTTEDGDITRSGSSGYDAESEFESHPGVEHVYSLGLLIPKDSTAKVVATSVDMEVLKPAPAPIGLKPRNISEELYMRERLVDIGGAVQRYINSQLDIPYAWVQEYMELEQKLLNLEKKA